jgi:hypothetical protein
MNNWTNLRKRLCTTKLIYYWMLITEIIILIVLLNYEKKTLYYWTMRKRLCTTELIYYWMRSYYWTETNYSIYYHPTELQSLLYICSQNKRHGKKTLKNWRKTGRGRRRVEGKEGVNLISQCFSLVTAKVVLAYYWTSEEHNTLLLKTNGHIGLWNFERCSRCWLHEPQTHRAPW